MTIEEYTEMSIRESLKVGELALKASKERQANGVQYEPPKASGTYKPVNDARIVGIVICVAAIAVVLLALFAIATKQY